MAATPSGRLVVFSWQAWREGVWRIDSARDMSALAETSLWSDGAQRFLELRLVPGQSIRYVLRDLWRPTPRYSFVNRAGYTATWQRDTIPSDLMHCVPKRSFWAIHSDPEVRDEIWTIDLGQQPPLLPSRPCLVWPDRAHSCYGCLRPVLLPANASRSTRLHLDIHSAAFARSCLSAAEEIKGYSGRRRRAIRST